MGITLWAILVLRLNAWSRFNANCSKWMKTNAVELKRGRVNNLFPIISQQKCAKILAWIFLCPAPSLRTGALSLIWVSVTLLQP